MHKVLKKKNHDQVNGDCVRRKGSTYSFYMSLRRVTIVTVNRLNRGGIRKGSDIQHGKLGKKVRGAAKEREPHIDGSANDC